MPCRTDDWTPSRDDHMSHGELEAVLCGILTVDEVVLNKVDWSEVGVSIGKVKKWWKEHKRKDAERRKREAERKKREQLIYQAKTKLTPEEIKALGL